MNVVELQDIRYRWRGQNTDTLAIDHLAIHSGEHLFIQGASGSGKSTLLNLLAGILLPQQGSIRLLDNDALSVSSTQRDRFRADHMGIIFQQFNLLPYLSVQENVELACHFSPKRKQKSRDVSATAQRLLTHLGLDDRLYNRPAMDLSVGQQQRVAVARALISNPELIIADEPTSALDADSRDHFIELLFSEVNAMGGTIVFVSHDNQLTKHFPRVITLQELNRA